MLPQPLNIVESVSRVFRTHTGSIDESLVLHYRIGAGTGLFTRALLAHPDWSEGTTVGRLKAYDPSSGMRAVFAEKIEDDRVTVAGGTFEKVDADDSWADLVVIAQVSLVLPVT